MKNTPDRNFSKMSFPPKFVWRIHLQKAPFISGIIRDMKKISMKDDVVMTSFPSVCGWLSDIEIKDPTMLSDLTMFTRFLRSKRRNGIILLGVKPHVTWCLIGYESYL